MIDPISRVSETQTYAGITTKRAKYAVGAHEQLISSVKQSATACLAVCIDSSSSGSLVSCQRHGVVNLLLNKNKKNIAYGDYILVQDIDPSWRPTIGPNMNLKVVGEVVAIYHDNPGHGYVSVRVRLTV